MIYPVPAGSPVTQTFDEHIARAKANGWCYKPGNCPGGIYYYPAIDWGVPNGTPIRAARDGVVGLVRKDTTGYGVHVRINHDAGYVTIYAHLREYIVAQGQPVEAGEIIGYSDNTGNSTGPHLHFEVRKDGVPVDPMPLLTGAAEPEPGQPVPAGAVRVTADLLNVRLGPGTDKQSLGMVKAGTILDATGDKSGDWIGVRLWVHGAYVEAGK